MAESCAACRYFLAAADAKPGTCRRLPPTVIAQGWIGHPGELQQGSALDIKGQQKVPVMVYAVNELASYFPNMEAETGWCGEFAPAGPAGSMN
jgi:hypothetical protein